MSTPLRSPADDEVDRFDVGDGRTLEIRPTSKADGELLVELYHSLSADDRRMRFFGAFEPRLSWCESWADVSSRGGYGVIAVVRDHSGDAGAVQVAGEAGYALRADGDGDFAVTVATPWRGWLGPYLVDRLIRHAAAAGVANLQADVMLGNGPMLAIIGRRDPVTLGHDDGTVHLSVGTATTTATWPPNEGRPRVLVATAGSRWAGERSAEAAGLATVMCPGPARRKRTGCPVLEGGRCPLADDADVIVVLLDPDDERTAQLIEAHRRLLPGTPILARRPTNEAPERDGTDDGDRGVALPDPHRTLPNGCTEIGLNGRDTVAQVLGLVGDREETSSAQPAAAK